MEPPESKRNRGDDPIASRAIHSQSLLAKFPAKGSRELELLNEPFFSRVPQPNGKGERRQCVVNAAKQSAAGTKDPQKFPDRELVLDDMHQDASAKNLVKFTVPERQLACVNKQRASCALGIGRAQAADHFGREIHTRPFDISGFPQRLRYPAIATANFKDAVAIAGL